MSSKSVRRTTGERSKSIRSGDGLNDASSLVFQGLGRRLGAEIREFVTGLPVQSRSVRSMASLLDINRNLCQRTIAAAQATQNGLEVISKTPGFSQLQVLVDAAESRSLAVKSTKQLRRTVQELSDLAAETCGSEAKFRAMLKALLERGTRESKETSVEVSSRRAIFEHGAEIAGSSTEYRAAIAMVWPSQDNSSVVDLAMTTIHKGHRGRKGGLPLTTYFYETADAAAEPGQNPQRIQSLSEEPVLLAQFSSRKLDFRKIEGSPGQSHQVVQYEDGASENTIDVVTLHVVRNVPHPAMKGSHPFVDVLLQISNPAKHLVFDFYLHNSLAQLAIPFFGTFVLGLGLDVEVRKAWYRQLPEGGQLQSLGTGLRNVSHRYWSMHAALTKHLAEELRLKDSELVGYRADVAFPIWGMTYAIGFDFSAAKSRQ